MTFSVEPIQPRLLQALWSKKLVIVAMALLFSAVGLLSVKHWPERYMSEGLLIIGTPTLPLSDAAWSTTPAIGAGETRTITDVLSSRHLAQVVTEDLAGEIATLDSVLAKGTGRTAVLVDAIPQWMLFWRENKGDSEPSDAMSELVDRFRSRFSIGNREGSNVLSVRFTSASATLAADAVNRLMQAYIQQDLNSKRDFAAQASSLFAQRLAAIKSAVATADANVAAYKAQHGVFQTAQGSVSAVALAEQQKRVSDARQDLARATADADVVQDAGAAGTKQALDSSTLQFLRNREAEASQQAAALKQRLGSSHPDVLRAMDALTDARRQTAAEIARILSGSVQTVTSARARLADAEAESARLRNSARTALMAEDNLAELQRDADAQRSVLASYLTRFEQVNSATQFPSARIISPAEPSSVPVGLRPFAIGLFSAVGGALCAAALIVLRLLTRQSISSSEEVVALTGLYNIGSLPALRGRANLPQVVLEQKQSGLAETLRGIRLNLEAARGYQQTAHSIVVLVTSSTVGDGKSTLAGAFARVCAADGLSVLLIDADLHRSRLDQILGVGRRKGASLQAVLQGDESFGRAVHIDQSTGMHCLLADRSPEPMKVIKSAKFVELISTARSRYDFVVIDSPPVMHVADALALSLLSDVTLFAVGSKRTTRSVLCEAIQRLPTQTRSRTVTVLTRVQGRQAGFSGYYAGYHGGSRSPMQLK